MNTPADRSPGNSSPASESHGSRRHGSRWLWISLIALVVLATAGAFLARPIWRTIKAYRAESFAAEGETMMREEKWSVAFERIRSALQLAPTNPRVLRLAAQLYARAGSDLAFPYFESLLNTPKATAEDREDYVALALRTGQAEIAATQLRSMVAAPNPSARTFLLAAQFHGSTRNLSNAIHYAREAVRLQPSNKTNSLALGRALLASSTPSHQKEAREVLWPLARVADAFRVPAIATMLSTPDSPRSEREEILTILDGIAQRSIHEEILRQEALVTLDPSRRTALADDLIERHGRTSPESTVAVASWLNRQQLFSQTLDLILPDLALKNPELLQIRYEALAGSGDLRAAYDFIVNAPSSQNPIQLEFLRCSTAIRLKDTAAADGHFKNLLDLAARDPRLLRSVADFALRNNRSDIANDAAKLLAKHPRDAAAAYATLLKIADSQGETWAARDYAKKLVSLRPPGSDDTIRLQIAYYDLLLNENIDGAFKEAQSMMLAATNDFTRRAVLGFAHLRRNEPKAAVDLIDHQFVSWSKIPPGIRAVTVAILGANQREKASSKLISRIPIARLKPEERELIRPYASGSTIPSSEEPLESDSTPEKL